MDRIKADLLAWLQARGDIDQGSVFIARDDNDALLFVATLTDGTPISAAIAVNTPL